MIATSDLLPGDTVRLLDGGEGLILWGPVYGTPPQSFVFWDDRRQRTGMYAWHKLALLCRGSSEDVARAERIAVAQRRPPRSPVAPED